MSIKITKEELNYLILEEYNLLLKEERINKIIKEYNNLSLKSKKECKRIGFRFYSNLHESKLIDSKTFNTIILKEGIGDWMAKKATNAALTAMGPVGWLVKKLNLVKDGDLLGLLQTVLDVAGFVPGFGEIADGINVAISALKKDYVGAALSAISMIPDLGDVIAKPIKYLLKAKKGIPLRYVQKIIPALEKFGPVILQKAKTIFSKIPIKNNKLEKIIPALENGFKIAAETIKGSAEEVASKAGNLAATKIKNMAKARRQASGTPNPLNMANNQNANQPA